MVERYFSFQVRPRWTPRSVTFGQSVQPDCSDRSCPYTPARLPMWGWTLILDNIQEIMIIIQAIHYDAQLYF